MSYPGFFFNSSATSTSVGTSLMTVEATDADTPYFNKITYTLLGDSQALRFFNVNPNTGVVTLKADISGEQDAIYR